MRFWSCGEIRIYCVSIIYGLTGKFLEATAQQGAREILKPRAGRRAWISGDAMNAKFVDLQDGLPDGARTEIDKVQGGSQVATSRTAFTVMYITSAGHRSERVCPFAFLSHFPSPIKVNAG